MITVTQLNEFKGLCYERGEDYVYAYPHALLRPYILHYAVTFPGNIPDDYTVLPSASSTMIFLVDGNDNINSGLSAVNTKSSTVGSVANKAKLLLLIEFRTGCLYPFLKVDQSELRDQYFTLHDLNASLGQSIENVLVHSNSLYELFAQLDHIFLTGYGEYDAMSCVSLLRNKIILSNGSISMKELTDACFYSDKHIRRLFQSYIGTSPKSLARIVRVNYVLNQMKQHQTSLTQIAMDSGYFDQSHFNNDLKMICDITPHDFLKNMSVYYKYDFNQ